MRDAGAKMEQGMKTLGQVAFESVNTKAFGYSWDATSDGTKKEYEFLAQAVRAAVIEECLAAMHDTDRWERSPATLFDAVADLKSKPSGA